MSEKWFNEIKPQNPKHIKKYKNGPAETFLNITILGMNGVNPFTSQVA